MSTSDRPESVAGDGENARRWWIALTVLVGMASAVITTTTVNVAIPDIMGAFGITQDVAHWLSTGALAGTTVAMLMQAWLVERFGVRTTFVWALGVFVASLVVAASAQDELVLIGARIVQGAISGLLQPLCIFLLFRVFPVDRKGQAMGLFGIVSLLGPAFGPWLGGLMTEHFSWRTIFILALPTSVAAMALGTLHLRDETRQEDRPPPFDWLSLGLASTALGSLLLALTNGPRDGWSSNEVLLTALLACSAGVAFVVREWRAPRPLVSLRLLAHPRFAAIALLSAIFGAGLFGSIYLVPLFVQVVQGLSPSQAGLLLMPGSIILAATLVVSGRLADRVPPRGPIVAGVLLFMASLLWMGGVDVDTPFAHLVAAVAVSRIGIALVNPSLNAAALGLLPPDQLAQGAGLTNFFRQFGGALGTTVVSLALAQRTAAHADALSPAASTTTVVYLRTVQDALEQAGLLGEDGARASLQFLHDATAAQATSLAFRDAFVVAGTLFAFAVLPALALRGHRGASYPSRVGHFDKGDA